MKKFKFFYYIAGILLISLITVSCQKNASVDDEREYRLGYNEGEKVAKADAIEHGCTGTVRNPSSNVYFQKRIYRAELKKTKSDKYIRGFLWGYENAFVDHIGLYCGGAFDDISRRRHSSPKKSGHY